MKRRESPWMRLSIVLTPALLLLSSMAGAESLTPTKEGFAETADGVRIHYRLLGPGDAPTLWVGYPWTEGWDRIMQDLGSASRGTDVRRQLLETLTEKYQVLYVDYPRGTGQSTGPLPGDINPDTVAEDYVAVADAAGIDRFVAMGYSWGAGFGIHVASRTKRCAGLAIGGWPVLGAPYVEILEGSGAVSSGLPADTAAGQVMRSNTKFYAYIVADIGSGDWTEEDAVESMRDRAGLLYL
ncbi:MAG: alpha/beta hydrolase, partial [Gammaproteobacteria bacterium]|nr:alpha/beta hydrolase [Gammaproteobacteria bacterium]